MKGLSTDTMPSGKFCHKQSHGGGGGSGVLKTKKKVFCFVFTNVSVNPTTFPVPHDMHQLPIFLSYRVHSTTVFK